MKVRNGFVSNSSSSSYIVEVPKGFSITAKDLTTPTAEEELAESDFWDNDTDTLKQEGVDAVNAELVNLAKGNSYWNSDYNRKTQLFWTLVEILEGNNLVVIEAPGPGGDGEDIIEPFEDLRKKKSNENT